MTQDFELLSEQRAREALDAFTDEDWREIVAFATADQHDRFPLGRWRDAGKEQQIQAAVNLTRQPAQVLASCAREAPRRMARLFRSFPKGAGAQYLAEILEHLDASRLPPESRGELLAYAWRVPKRPLMEGCLAVLTATPLPQWTAENVEQFAWYMTKARSKPQYVAKLTPVAEDRYREPHRLGGKHYGGDPYVNGQYTARGKAVSWLADGLDTSPDEMHRLRPTLAAIARHKSVAVRACFIALLARHHRHWPGKTVEWFTEACEGAPELPGIEPADQFLQAAVRGHYPRLVPVIQSAMDEREQLGGLLAAGRALASAALHWPAAAGLADEAFDSFEQVREEMVKLLAANWAEGSTGYALPRLRQMLVDPSRKMRAMARSAGDGIALMPEPPPLEQLAAPESEELLHTLRRAPAPDWHRRRQYL